MFSDIGKIMKLAGQMKTKLPELKEKLAHAEFAAESGGGAVRATVNGKMQLIDLNFSEKVLEDQNLSLDMLEDLVKAAINAAQTEAEKGAAEAMKELTGGVELPGLDGLM